MGPVRWGVVPSGPTHALTWIFQEACREDSTTCHSFAKLFNAGSYPNPPLLPHSHLKQLPALSSVTESRIRPSFSSQTLKIFNKSTGFFFFKVSYFSPSIGVQNHSPKTGHVPVMVLCGRVQYWSLEGSLGKLCTQHFIFTPLYNQSNCKGHAARQPREQFMDFSYHES